MTYSEKTRTKNNRAELPDVPQKSAMRWEKKNPTEMLLEVLRCGASLDHETCSQSECEPQRQSTIAILGDNYLAMLTRSTFDHI